MSTCRVYQSALTDLSSFSSASIRPSCVSLHSWQGALPDRRKRQPCMDHLRRGWTSSPSDSISKTTSITSYSTFGDHPGNGVTITSWKSLKVPQSCANTICWYSKLPGLDLSNTLWIPAEDSSFKFFNNSEYVLGCGILPGLAWMPLFEVREQSSYYHAEIAYPNTSLSFHPSGEWLKTRFILIKNPQMFSQRHLGTRIRCSTDR